MVTQSFCYTASHHFLSYIRFPLPYTLVCLPHHTQFGYFMLTITELHRDAIILKISIQNDCKGPV